MRLSIHDGNLEYFYFILNTITEIIVIPVSALCSAQNLGIPDRNGAPMAARSIPRTLLPWQVGTARALPFSGFALIYLAYGTTSHSALRSW